MIDHSVLAHLFAEELRHFRNGIVSDDEVEQDKALAALVELFIANAAALCPLCANRRTAIYN